MQFLSDYFSIQKSGSTIKTEVLAGITTFMAMSYILAVQPSLMAQVGMPADSVVVSTAILSAFATITMALYAKYPFALAPGMGPNIFFVYTLVGSTMFTWQQGLTLVLCSGIFFLLTTLLGLREAIARFLPSSIKLGIGATVGVFLIYLGLQFSGIITLSEEGMTLSNFSSPSTLLSLFAFFFMLLLHSRGIVGSLFIGIIITTLLGIPFGITQIPKEYLSMPPSITSIFFAFDFTGIVRIETVTFILLFFIGEFFDTLGTLFGLSAKAGFLDKEGNLPNVEKPFLVDAVSTILGSICGLTTVTTYIESASGLAIGGRTGLTAFVTGICFIVAIFFTPFMLMIPSAATAPCLILIGIVFLDGLRHVEFGKLEATIAPLSMVSVAIFTASISTGVAVGVILYTVSQIASGKIKEIHPGLYILCAIFIYYLATR
ncbi:MAG: NCS2 family permease [Desulfovibrionaceae bacterium]